MVFFIMEMFVQKFMDNLGSVVNWRHIQVKKSIKLNILIMQVVVNYDPTDLQTALLQISP